ncbi:unknown [Bacteroides sp. CAG:770]|nr:unknown [Bacteroides sp. CAG:770]
MVADCPITGERTLCPAVPDFLLKLGVVLLEQLQQGFLLDADTEIGIF